LDHASPFCKAFGAQNLLLKEVRKNLLTLSSEYHLALPTSFGQFGLFLQKHLRECDTCQRNENENLPYLGLLQPFHIPDKK
jgi:hypothetical protein